MKSILVVTAVQAEQQAVQRGLAGDDRFHITVAGVGAAAAAAAVSALLAAPHSYKLVLAAGIAGGFSGRAAVGTLAIADHIIAADLGADTADGFLSLDELGFGSAAMTVDARQSLAVAASLRAAGLTCALGTILTVSTVTGTAERALELQRRIPGAVAEAMEGYGVAVAAHLAGLPVIELRAISNPVGPRDREAWKIREALDSLQQACSVIKEVL